MKGERENETEKGRRGEDLLLVKVREGDARCDRYGEGC